MFALLLAVVLPAAAAETPGKSESLAEVEGEAITSGEIEQTLGARLRTLDEQIYTLNASYSRP